MEKTYILNKETQKIELHFSKSEYQGLSDSEKRELKSTYLFSGKAQAWVSRSTNNHYSALRVAEKLGFTNGGSIGECLSYEEELNRKAEKAENRIERYEQYAENAEQRAEGLQKAFNSHRGDIAFLTQPIYNNAGGRAFKNYKDKIMNRYEKGFEEYRKSEYFKNKAITAGETANMEQLKDKVYLNNRIKECNSAIKKLEESIIRYEDIIYKKQNNIEIKNSFINEKSIEDYQGYLQNTLEKMEYELDKLAFLENKFDEIGGNKYNKENIKTGYLVKIRGTWETVLKANKITVETQPIQENIKMFIMKHPYAEIQDMKIPEGFKENEKKIETIENPYKVNDILIHNAIGSDYVITAYQVLKTTAKGVTLQKIKVEDNKPIRDNFISDKTMQKKIVKSKYSDFIGCYDNGWQLNLYKEA